MESRFHPSDSIVFYLATNYNEWICTVVRDEINSIPFRFDAAPTFRDIKLAFIILKRVIIRNQYTICLLYGNNESGIHFKAIDLESIYREYKENFLKFYVEIVPCLGEHFCPE